MIKKVVVQNINNTHGLPVTKKKRSAYIVFLLIFQVLATFAFVAVAYAGDESIGTVRQESEINPDGSYQYAWETDAGTIVQEQGALKKIGEDEVEAIVSKHFI